MFSVAVGASAQPIPVRLHVSDLSKHQISQQQSHTLSHLLQFVGGATGVTAMGMLQQVRARKLLPSTPAKLTVCWPPLSPPRQDVMSVYNFKDSDHVRPSLLWGPVLICPPR
jgi:hypothetical protein